MTSVRMNGTSVQPSLGYRGLFSAGVVAVTIGVVLHLPVYVEARDMGYRLVGMPIDWTMAIVAGLLGSFIGGLLISLLSGDGLDLKPSGIIGSLAGAILVTAGWRWWDSRNKPTAADRAAKRSGDPRKSHPR